MVKQDEDKIVARAPGPPAPPTDQVPVLAPRSQSHDSITYRTVGDPPLAADSGESATAVGESLAAATEESRQ